MGVLLPVVRRSIEILEDTAKARSVRQAKLRGKAKDRSLIDSVLITWGRAKLPWKPRSSPIFEVTVVVRGLAGFQATAPIFLVATPFRDFPNGKSV